MFTSILPAITIAFVGLQPISVHKDAADHPLVGSPPGKTYCHSDHATPLRSEHAVCVSGPGEEVLRLEHRRPEDHHPPVIPNTSGPASHSVTAN
ncbi:hypothetical protein [Paracoccus sp. ME4]|uniref:hypothetical protein n=1 Tax=Paracoccus sp. ME4 TaxID=3138066 RepID=UPI00398A859A